MKNTNTKCSRCNGSQWTSKGLCWSCDARPLLADVAKGVRTVESAHMAIDELEAGL